MIEDADPSSRRVRSEWTWGELDPYPLQPLDTSSPRETFQSFNQDINLAICINAKIKKLEVTAVSHIRVKKEAHYAPRIT